MLLIAKNEQVIEKRKKRKNKSKKKRKKREKGLSQIFAKGKLKIVSLSFSSHNREKKINVTHNMVFNTTGVFYNFRFFYMPKLLVLAFFF